MDIKKLGLASTVAMLSVTVALSGCDFLKYQAEIEGDKAQATLSKARDEWNKAFKEETNTVEYKQKLSVNLFTNMLNMRKLLLHLGIFLNLNLIKMMLNIRKLKLNIIG
ncbi:hypothetical protein LSO9J_80018 [Candidatus Liberibacter solanacearum]|uniref:hypothetical protein n=1 Tax=Candidatus Liberibacter solanacearum TaxID=556287 RepID=UPI003871AB59